MTTSQYHWKRKATQLGVLLLFTLIPTVGLLRIDLTTASFFVLGHQIWWSNFPFVIGLALVFATAPILTYMTIGAVWCGWACPQNLVSEWANNLTYKLLGKRADMRVDGEGMVVAAAKNKAANWVVLITIILSASFVLALIPFLFFFPFSDVWAIVSGGFGQQTNWFILYLFVVLLIFVDIFAVRYFLCDYACVYRIGQRIFKTQDALHVTYDASRSDTCSKCNYCATTCITNIEPTNIKQYDPCIDCGECIDACNRLQAKSGGIGLLRFEVGEKGGKTTWREKLGEIAARFNWLVGAIFLLGCVMMVWGIVTQPTIAVPISHDEQLKNQQIARICSSKCATLQASCNGKNIDGCYRAAACKCECSLEQDPGNALSGTWRQCVQNNTAHEQALGTHKLPDTPSKP
jgi:hypothetical protein